jgi:hypothetical protein
VSGVEERLRDLRRATAERVHPSPALLGRIEASLEPRPPRRWVLRVAVVAVAAAVLAVALVAGQRDRSEHVVSRPPTRQEFIAAANARCRAFTAARDRVTVVFPTPEAYGLAADNLTSAVGQGMADAQSIGAPPEAQSVLADVMSHLRAALDQVQVTKERATARDVDGAAAAYAAANQEIDQAGAAAARYGATDCQLPGQP